MAEHPMSGQPPFAVLFDMDGLMLDTERMARRAWTGALSAHGYEMDEPSYLRLLGRTTGDVQQILHELFGPELPFVEIYRMRSANYEADIAMNGIRTRPGLLELLDFLEEKNIPKAVASSTVHWFVLHKLERAGIAHPPSTRSAETLGDPTCPAFPAVQPSSRSR